jgi:hypothetical protein
LVWTHGDAGKGHHASSLELVLSVLLARLGAEDRPEQRGEHALLLLAGVPERLAQEVPLMPMSA